MALSTFWSSCTKMQASSEGIIGNCANGSPKVLGVLVIGASTCGVCD